jgi:hypothetical protein
MYFKFKMAKNKEGDTRPAVHAILGEQKGDAGLAFHFHH